MKITIPSVIITLLIACIEPSQNAHAVTPAPDGGYPGANTAEGDSALLSLTDGSYNTAVGFFSLRANTQGNFNTATGAGALLSNAGAFENTATGAGALLNNAASFLGGGNGNTGNGAFALFHNTSGSHNTAVGDRALFNNTTGSNNIALGDSAGSAVTTASNVIAIGTAGSNQGGCFIGHIRGVTTGNNNALPVLIDSVGQLGTGSSSRRFKKDIKPIRDASKAILALEPVTFHYKSDNTDRPEFGLVAEDVAEVNPDLVVRDESGQAYTVRYDAVNAMLLNEFLKEHRKVGEQGRKIREQETTIAELKSRFKALAARVNEQGSQLQKVSVQLQINNPAARVVSRSPR